MLVLSDDIHDTQRTEVVVSINIGISGVCGVSKNMGLQGVMLSKIDRRRSQPSTVVGEVGQGIGGMSSQNCVHQETRRLCTNLSKA